MRATAHLRYVLDLNGSKSGDFFRPNSGIRNTSYSPRQVFARPSAVSVAAALCPSRVKGPPCLVLLLIIERRIYEPLPSPKSTCLVGDHHLPTGICVSINCGAWVIHDTLSENQKVPHFATVPCKTAVGPTKPLGRGPRNVAPHAWGGG